MSPQTAYSEESAEQSGEYSGTELLVTGTRLGAAMATSPVFVVTRDDIDRGGFSSIDDLMRSVTQNFGQISALSAAASQGGQFIEQRGRAGFAGNPNAGTGVNLRGLGGDATVVLVNGRRLASNGTNLGSFTDVSSIPLSMVERIEILADGASAIYGADAVGGVVNIILRNDYTGGQVSVRYGSSSHRDAGYNAAISYGFSGEKLRASGALSYFHQDFLSPAKAGYTTSDHTSRGGTRFEDMFTAQPGHVFDLSTLQISKLPDGQDGTALDYNAIEHGVTRFGEWLPITLIPEQNRYNLALNLESDLSPRLTLFFDARYQQSRVSLPAEGPRISGSVPPGSAYYPANAPGTPFVVFYIMNTEFLSGKVPNANSENITRVWNANAGLTWNLPSGGWVNESYVTYGREAGSRRAAVLDRAAVAAALADPDPATAFNAFGDGTAQTQAAIDRLFVDGRFTSLSELIGVESVFRGELFRAPGGPVAAALGAGYRREKWDSTGPAQLAQYSEPGLFDPRSMWALFGEFGVPLAPALVLSAAGRYEEYDDFGSTFNPKIGLRWSLSDAVALRANWGTSFKTPGVDQVSGGLSDSFIGEFFDPYAPGGADFVAPVTLMSGPNPDLSEETADTWSAGVDLRVAGLTVQLNYFAIDFKDRIRSSEDPAVVDYILANVGRFPGIAERDAQGNLTMFNTTPINLASEKTSGWDLSAKCTPSTPRWETSCSRCPAPERIR